jgi:hypothetical protein
MDPTTDTPTDRGWTPVLVALLVALVLAVLVVASVIANRDEPATPDVCDVAARFVGDVGEAFTTAEAEGATAGEVRERVDRVLADLAALGDAAPDRFELQIGQMRESALDIRRSLTDLGDDTPFDEARPLVDEAIDDAQPFFDELTEAIAPLCANRED